MIYQGNAIEYIYETPDILRHIWENRRGILKEGILLLKEKQMTDLYITGSGSSFHSAIAGQLFLQKILGIRVHAVSPVPFLDDMDYIDINSAVISISQQGTSVASINVLDEAGKRGMDTISMTGEYHTEITRHGKANIYVECGYEDAGATTKGYTATVFTLMVFGIELAFEKERITDKAYRQYEKTILNMIENMPNVISRAENWYGNIQEELQRCSNLIILACENQRAAMLEGVLKFSETCRFPVRGFEVEEFMHGMYNAVDEKTYFLYVAAPGRHRARMMQLYHYYQEQKQIQFGLNVEEDKTENISRCFQNTEEFEGLEYILAIQILYVNLSKAKGINMNVPKDPDFHKKMNSKLES